MAEAAGATAVATEEDSTGAGTATEEASPDGAVFKSCASSAHADARGKRKGSAKTTLDVLVATLVSLLALNSLLV
jgi:hypothetical protein